MPGGFPGHAAGHGRRQPGCGGAGDRLLPAGLRAGPAAARLRPVPAQVPQEVTPSRDAGAVHDHRGTDPATGDAGRPVDRRRPVRRRPGRRRRSSCPASCCPGSSTRTATSATRTTGPATLDEAEEQARTNLRRGRAGSAGLRLAGGHPAAGRPGRPAGADPGRPAHRQAQAVHPRPGRRSGRPGRAAGRGGQAGWRTATAGSRSSATGSTGRIGDLAPLWPDDVLAEAIAVAHAGGARVTTHVFGEDALPGLLAAGRRLHRARHRADRRHHRDRRRAAACTWSRR